MVFFNHYYLPTRLISFACQEALSVSSTTRGAKCLRTLCSYQEVSLCLVSQVTYDLVPSRLVSLALLSPTYPTTTLHRLSQAYGCSDRYIKTKILHRGGTTRNNSTRVGTDGTIRPLRNSKKQNTTRTRRIYQNRTLGYCRR